MACKTEHSLSDAPPPPAGIIELILTCLLSAETTPDAGCGSWRKQLESSRAASSERGVTSERQTAEWVSAERETLRERAASEHARRTELTRSTNERTNGSHSLTQQRSRSLTSRSSRYATPQPTSHPRTSSFIIIIIIIIIILYYAKGAAHENASTRKT